MALEITKMSLTQIVDLYYTLTRSANSKNAMEVIAMLNTEIVSRVANKEYTTVLPTRPI